MCGGNKGEQVLLVVVHSEGYRNSLFIPLRQRSKVWGFIRWTYGGDHAPLPAREARQECSV